MREQHSQAWANERAALTGMTESAYISNWVSQGIPAKLPYKCTVYSDNCGSMQLVRDMAHELHMAHD